MSRVPHPTQTRSSHEAQGVLGTLNNKAVGGDKSGDDDMFAVLRNGESETVGSVSHIFYLGKIPNIDVGYDDWFAVSDGVHLRKSQAFLWPLWQVLRARKCSSAIGPLTFVSRLVSNCIHTQVRLPRVHLPYVWAPQSQRRVPSRRVPSPFAGEAGRYSTSTLSHPACSSSLALDIAGRLPPPGRPALSSEAA